MLKQERQELILSEITSKNKVQSTDLSLKLRVSEDTIRRDLKELADQGYLKKVHGGAMANPVAPNSEQNESVSYKTERIRIVEKCIPLIHRNNVLIIEGHESAVILADYLPSDFPLTVFTNSLPVALRLLQSHHVETFFMGGKISSRNKSSSGMEVIQNLSEIRADLCFTELSALHMETGMTDSDREYALTKKAILNSASIVVGMSLSTDLGNVQPFRIDMVSKLSKLITELNSENDQLTAFRDKGIEVL